MEWLPNLATVLVSGSISIAASLFTAKKAAQHELTKIGFQYEHDDNAQLKEAYSKMHSTTLIYIDCATPPHKRDALTALSELITISPPELRQELQLLQSSLMQIQPFNRKISSSDIGRISDTLKSLDDIWATLSLATKKKRKNK